MINRVESVNESILFMFRIFFIEEDDIDLFSNDIVNEFVLFPLDLLN